MPRHHPTILPLALALGLDFMGQESRPASPLTIEDVLECKAVDVGSGTCSSIYTRSSGSQRESSLVEKEHRGPTVFGSGAVQDAARPFWSCPPVWLLARKMRRRCSVEEVVISEWTLSHAVDSAAPCSRRCLIVTRVSKTEKGAVHLNG